MFLDFASLHHVTYCIDVLKTWPPSHYTILIAKSILTFISQRLKVLKIINNINVIILYYIYYNFVVN